MKKVTLFLSCVSAEFHTEDKSLDANFFSWRTHLEHSLNGLERAEIVVITQESALAAEQGDLLEILEQAVRRSDYVIHLYGELAGQRPQERSLRLLRERHPDFLAHAPEIRACLPEWPLISFTQWELYFAFQFFQDQRRKPLIYLAADGAPRSPSCQERLGVAEELQSKERHLKVVQASGQLRTRLRNQDHLASLVQTYLLKQGVFEPAGLLRSSAEALAAARATMGELVRRVAQGLGVGRSPVLGGPLPVNGRKALEAVESAAASAGITAPELVELVEARFDERAREAGASPTFADLYDQAFDFLALGDLAQAMLSARQAADVALAQSRSGREEERAAHRDHALDALLLLHDIARLLGDVLAAISALREGSPLFDQEKDPLRWADYHLLLAEYFRETGYTQEAEDLLQGVAGDTAADDVPGVLDLYEKEYGRENDEEETALPLAQTLYYLARTKDANGHYADAIPFARRAARILRRQTPPDVPYIVACLNQETQACMQMARWMDALQAAEPAVRMAEDLILSQPSNFGLQHGLSVALSNVGRIREAQGELGLALAMFERAQRIFETLAEKEPTNLAWQRDLSTVLNNVGRIRQEEGELGRALTVFERAQKTCETLAEKEPANLAWQRDLSIALNNVARIREAQGELGPALAIYERAHRIRETLAEKEPANLAWQRELSIALNNVGRIREVQGELGSALTIFEHSQRICATLAEKEPANLLLQSDLYLACYWVGRVARQIGQREVAVRHLQRALELARGLEEKGFTYGRLHADREAIESELGRC